MKLPRELTRLLIPTPQEREKRILEALFPDHIGAFPFGSGCHPFGAEPVVSGKAGIPNAGDGQ